MAAATATDANETGTKPAAPAKGKGGASAGGRSQNGTKSKASTAPKGRGMTQEHKEALAIGRSEGRTVNEYLDALEAHKPKRGRKVTPESIKERIRKINEETLPQATGAERLNAIQQRIDLEEQLRRTEDTFVIDDLEAAFKKVAASYAARRGISYDAFREAGVPADVLKEAGVLRRAS